MMTPELKAIRAVARAVAKLEASIEAAACSALDADSRLKVFAKLRNDLSTIAARAHRVGAPDEYGRINRLITEAYERASEVKL